MEEMTDGGYQKELFEFKDPKKPFVKLGRILPKSGFVVALTPEKAVFSAIGLIMFMVIVYALGVERGKAISIESVVVPAPKSVKPPQPQIPFPREKTAAAAARPVTPALSAKTRVESMPKAAVNITRPYTIVVATFSRKEWASKETERLKREGLNAFVTQRDPYFVICIGSYATKEAAQDTMKRLKKTYRDAYFYKLQ